MPKGVICLVNCINAINGKTCCGKCTASTSILDTYTNPHPFVCDRGGKLGIAIDIGTTTLAFNLLDIKTGELLGVYSSINSQGIFGADVISRIKSANDGHLEKLNACIVNDIYAGIKHILNGRSGRDVSLVVIAGNTTMLHLLQNLSCDTLGVSPFTPISTGTKIVPVEKILDVPARRSDAKGGICEANVLGNNLLDCDAIILPGISAFVGADIVAGLLCAGWPNVKGYNLLIDLGTNGEMAVFSNDKIIVTSAAAGPVFEAANISQGVACVAGAIAEVNFLPESYVFSFETIDNSDPIGICGTGVVDICAELVRHKLVDETGFIESGDDKIYITPSIAFTQRDIREVQLAKSAVRSGIEVLLEIAGIGYADLVHVFVAGGFGNKINIENAATLGLIPQGLKHKIISLGNASLGGCVKVLLSQKYENYAKQLATLATEINLAEYPQFADYFMDYIGME